MLPKISRRLNESCRLVTVRIKRRSDSIVDFWYTSSASKSSKIDTIEDDSDRTVKLTLAICAWIGFLEATYVFGINNILSLDQKSSDINIVEEV